MLTCTKPKCTALHKLKLISSLSLLKFYCTSWHFVVGFLKLGDYSQLLMFLFDAKKKKNPVIKNKKENRIQPLNRCFLSHGLADRFVFFFICLWYSKVYNYIFHNEPWNRGVTWAFPQPASTFFSKSEEEQQDVSENYWVGKLVRHGLAKFYCNLILKLISL